ARIATRPPADSPSARSAPANRATRSPISVQVRLRSPKIVAVPARLVCTARLSPCVIEAYMTGFAGEVSGRSLLQYTGQTDATPFPPMQLIHSWTVIAGIVSCSRRRRALPDEQTETRVTSHAERGYDRSD